MDIFAILNSGSKFDKKRFASDFEIFKLPKEQQLNSEQDNHVPISLDFFSKPTINDVKETNQVKSKNKSKKINSKTHEPSTVQEEEEEFELFDSLSLKQFRVSNNIKVYGIDIPHPIRSFTHLFQLYSLPQFLRNNINSLSFDSPTPIQLQAIPIMIKNRDLMACAPTGSGKTLSFILPILHKLGAPQKSGCRAVIISPTRELAQQIYRHTKDLSQGKSFKTAILSSNENESKKLSNYDIIITTPLRLVHFLQSNLISLHNVQHLVLDEADKLLELGFLEQMDEIIASCTNTNIQKSLYSATISSSVEELANSFMKDPIRVVIGSKNAATSTINQKLLYVGQESGKIIAMRQLIQQGVKPPVLVFVQSIDRAKELFHELVYDNINVDVIHSERTQAQRESIVEHFRTGKIWILICTELMARGIDFKGVNLVINYDFPQTVASYIHRIGRTGRAQRLGEAVTYFTKEDSIYLKSIVNVMRESGCEVPEWMLKLKKPSKNTIKKLKSSAPQREQIKTTSKYDENQMKRKQQMIEDTKTKKVKTIEE